MEDWFFLPTSNRGLKRSNIDLDIFDRYYIWKTHNKKGAHVHEPRLIHSLDNDSFTSALVLCSDF